MSNSFEHQLEADLAAAAAEFELPPPDFHHRVRAQVAVRQRRRRTVLAAGGAACAAAVLAVTLAVTGTGGTARPVGPAADGGLLSGGPTATPTPGTPWWQQSGATAVTSPVLAAFWDARSTGPYTDVQVLEQKPLGNRFLLLVAGQRPDGERRLLLLLSDRSAQDGLSADGLHFLTERAAPPAPAAPIGLSYNDGAGPSATRVMTVLAPPCAGQRRLSLGSGEPLTWLGEAPDTLRVVKPVPATATVLVRCEAPGSPSSYQLMPSGPPVLAGTTAVSLFVGV
ncbi:hypothetical protein P3T36_006773 [Kitasatospora sp. MAP12-15]|uniref:hypothetical protein n=1 Tax=unclassified Kitasatospora TaxID=2633591 RepID=UPI0024735119|nr:hypothetical protein [Kitasatospora sp. MAP12-44]MDH6111593.1 hypothetical protein [Kitasatospora sp. MAP12-44]